MTVATLIGTGAAQVTRLLELTGRLVIDAALATHDAGVDIANTMGRLLDAPRTAYRERRLEHYRRDLTPDERVVEEQLERMARIGQSFSDAFHKAAP